VEKFFQKKNEKKYEKIFFLHKKDIILPAKFCKHVNGLEIFAANDWQ